MNGNDYASSFGYGFEAGRCAEVQALREVVAALPGRLGGGVWRPGWRRVLLAGIGASCAALASPMHRMRAAGMEVFRTDCSDFPSVAGQRPDVVVALSQGGRSRETTDLVSRFRTAGVATLAVTNTDDNPLRGTSDASLTLGGYPDSRVSTVGFVVTFAALGMLGDVAATGRVDGRWAQLPGLIEDAVAAAAKPLAAFAEGPLATGAVDIVAAAPQLTTAEAVALLFREGPLVPSTAHGTRAYLHGYMDSAGQGTGHVVVGGERELQLARQLTQKPAGILTVTDGTLPLPPGVSGVTVPAHLTGPQRALVEVCVLQELVSAVAVVRGNPVDEVAFSRHDTKIDALGEL